MQSEEQRLIEGLFQRLKQAERNAGPRDATADRQIQGLVQQQPAAPYYMAQSMLIQEAALNRLNAQVKQLESEIEQLKSAAPASSGGFLSGLFGGGARQAAPQTNQSWGNAPQQMAPTSAPSGYNGYAQPPAPRGGGFLSGALKTAAGVAGGVMLADMLTGMFHQSRPEEIVNIIDDPASAGSDALTNQDFASQAENLDTFNDVPGNPFPDQDDGLVNNDYADYGGDDGFNDDDDFI